MADGRVDVLMGPLVELQLLAERLLSQAPAITEFMRLTWSWPAVESVHFIGLTLLFGCIAAWDLRLLGFASFVPVSAFHRLVPFAVAGFLMNAASGVLFLLADADQYIYNSAFLIKVFCLLLAGLNVLVFYAVIFPRMDAHAPGAHVPAAARLSGAASLLLWTTVIVCGRMITFYRPIVCLPEVPIGWLAWCVPR